MTMPLNRTALLLHVADDPNLLSSRNSMLASRWNVVSTDSRSAWNIFNSNDFDMAILCHSIPQMRRRWLVAHICETSPSTPILVVADDRWLIVSPPAIMIPSEPEVLMGMVGRCLVNSERSALSRGA